jgi:hypothetical protein
MIFCNDKIKYTYTVYIVQQIYVYEENGAQVLR